MYIKLNSPELRGMPAAVEGPGAGPGDRPQQLLGEHGRGLGVRAQRPPAPACASVYCSTIHRTVGN